MKYLCLAYFDREKWDALPREELAAIVKQCPAYDAQLLATGKLRAQGALGMPDKGAAIRPRAGKVSVTDGPFIETHEQIGGMFILEAESLAEAIELASKHPAAHLGEHIGWGIEVRPIHGYQEHAEPKP